MIAWTLTFLIMTIIAAVLAFTGLAGAFAWLAKMIFALFLIIALVTVFLL